MKETKIDKINLENILLELWHNIIKQLSVKEGRFEAYLLITDSLIYLNKFFHNQLAPLLLKDWVRNNVRALGFSVGSQFPNNILPTLYFDSSAIALYNAVLFNFNGKWSSFIKKEIDININPYLKELTNETDKNFLMQCTKKKAKPTSKNEKIDLGLSLIAHTASKNSNLSQIESEINETKWEAKMNLIKITLMTIFTSMLAIPARAIFFISTGLILMPILALLDKIGGSQFILSEKDKEKFNENVAKLIPCALLGLLIGYLLLKATKLCYSTSYPAFKSTLNDYSSNKEKEINLKSAKMSSFLFFSKENEQEQVGVKEQIFNN